MSSVPEELSQRLCDAAAKRADHQRLAAELVTVDSDLLRAQQLVARWGREVGMLAERLREMSGFRPIAFVRSLFRDDFTKREQLERQLSDAQDAHNEADSRIPRLKEQRQEIVSAQATVAGACEDHAAALAAKESWLLEQGVPFAGPLAESAALIRASVAEKEALDSLVLYGSQAEHELLIAKHVAPLHGHAPLSNGKFDECRRHMARAADHLRVMSDEADRHGEVLRKIEARTGATLVDFLLNNLWLDSFEQHDIESVRQNVSDMIDRVRPVVWAAQQQRKLVCAELAKVQGDRERWIEQAG